jgi:hypothetical protein
MTAVRTNHAGEGSPPFRQSPMVIKIDAAPKVNTLARIAAVVAMSLVILLPQHHSSPRFLDAGAVDPQRLQDGLYDVGGV